MAQQPILSFERTRQQQLFVEELKRRGATSPASACPEQELPRVSREQFRLLLDDGVIREAAPGTFYVYEDRVAPPSGTWRDSRPKRIVVALLFWLVVISLPMVLVLWTQ